MQKVLRRVDLAKGQAARKKRILEEKEAVQVRLGAERILRRRNREFALADKRARHLHREAWMLGDLSPLNSPALNNSPVYGAFSMMTGQQLPEKPKPQQRKDFYIVKGDRVCVVNGRDGIRGKIGKVEFVYQEADAVTVEGVNLVRLANLP